MLPPNWLAAAAKDAEKMYELLNQEITKDIARRIIKTGRVTDTADWQIRKAQESGKLMNDIIKDVAKATGMTDREIEQLFKDAGITSVAIDAQKASLAGIAASKHMSPAMQQVLEADIRKTQGNLHNLTMTTAITGQDAYINAINLATMKVESGAYDYETAIRQAVDQVVGTGAEVLYGSGRMSLEAAARMSIMTSLSQTTGKISEMNCESLGAEYVEVSAHPGAREEHAVWQGQVYQLHGAGQYENFYEATGYGDITGLCGVNCRHSFYPFFPGLSVPAYTKQMLDEYEEAKYPWEGDLLTEYEASQKQRQMERNIRESNRKIAGIQAALDECRDDATRSELERSLARNRKNLRKRRKKLTNFCKQTGLEKDYSRTRIARQALKGNP